MVCIINTYTPIGRCPFGTVTHTFASLITPCPDYGNDRERQHALPLFLSRSFNAEFTAAQARPTVIASTGSTGSRGYHWVCTTLGARPACSHAYREEGRAAAGTHFEFVFERLLVVTVMNESVTAFSKFDGDYIRLRKSWGDQCQTR